MLEMIPEEMEKETAATRIRQIPKAVLEFREGASISDAKRDEKYSIPEEIFRYEDISYGPYGKWNLLDVYHEKGVGHPQPTIIDIHGGGWCYGDKELYQYYCMDLAKRGFTVVNFSYRLAPENPFPAALEDINAVFWWIIQNAEKYCIDLEHLYVAGDSAGAQLASQYVTMIINPEYAALYPEMELPSKKIPLSKSLSNEITSSKSSSSEDILNKTLSRGSVEGEISVKAVLLNCGIYDMKRSVLSKIDELYTIYLADAYNDCDVREKTLEKIDVMKYLTSDFPPAYIMTSTHDFLREYAEPMYKKLRSLGVPCVLKTYGDEEDETMGHVFHLDIAREISKQCNDEECDFLRYAMSI